MKCCQCTNEARHTSPSGWSYCDEHIICDRCGDVIQWRQDDYGWLCMCRWGMTTEEAIARRMAKKVIRPNWDTMPLGRAEMVEKRHKKRKTSADIYTPEIAL